MNTGMAVLLAMVLIVVVLLIVWVVLRSRSTSASATTAGSSVPAGVGAAAAPDPAGPEEVEQTGAAALGSPGGDPSDGADLAEEYAGTGLSELGDRPATGTETGDSGTDDTGTDDAGTDPRHDTDRAARVTDAGPEADAESSAPAPRTPAEAFGDADGGGTTERASMISGTSVLDEPDVDSTPLFRSIRQERLAAAPNAPADVSTPVEPPEVVGEQPGLSEQQAHRADVNEPDGDQRAAEPRSGVTDSDGATVHVEDPGPAPVMEAVPATEAVTDEAAAATDEEDHDVPSDQETITPPAGPETASEEVAPPGGEHPPVRRISELHEVVDGGFGIGSAAPIPDGAQPLGHPIKANVDTKTYQDLHSPWYDSTEPDVWFLDPGFAERAGFHRAD